MKLYGIGLAFWLLGSELLIVIGDGDIRAQPYV